MPSRPGPAELRIEKDAPARLRRVVAVTYQHDAVAVHHGPARALLQTPFFHQWPSRFGQRNPPHTGLVPPERPLDLGELLVAGA